MPGSAVQTAWKILYGINLEDIPDPNKPENIPYLKAQKKQRIDAFEHLKNGPARVLFEAWADKIMKLNMGLLFTPKDKLCLCPACQTIREMRAALELWVEAETILKEKE